ncbi:Asp/Glu racemase [Roseococcus sp. SYP-B2431]|uniref:aspartate/glutamate racemase family protein n=1 Tax=Roseococcus sp. SYP-B2431 TaxID=2496640 RepID=UPI001038FFEE|nr:aspartate/glutamate racemase family protein [Roseococcus sp. SYP-B2431]TCH99066.1 Asp/Glu racemase [Roseococcus sp. SYP-B2431]
MKLLLLNGNTDPAITERLAAAARGMCGHEIVPATARFGARYIATRAASAIAAHAVLDLLAERVGADNPEGFGAAIIACFGDPGLDAAREMLPIPVLGLADASIPAALRLGARVALLTGGTAWVPMLREFALLRGYAADQVRVAAVAPTGDMIAREPDRALDLLAEAAEEQAAAGADAVVLGGAGLVGLADRLRSRVSVPVLDCLRVTLESAQDARPGTTPMQPAPSVGLSDALARALEG